MHAAGHVRDTGHMSAPMVLGSSRGPQIVKGVDTIDEPGWAAPTVVLDGVASSSPMSPTEFPLWLVRGTLADGASLRWQLPHGDEVVYVLAGELEVDGRICPTGGSIVVESGVPAVATARGATTVVHFGPVDPVPPTAFAGPPDPDGHVAHVIGPAGTYQCIEGNRDTRYYMDSTCPTCRATLLYTGRAEPYVSNAHSHSADEIIFVLTGEVQLGAYTVGVGDSMCVAKDVRYKFNADDGFLMLNYRCDGSYQTIDRDKPPILEGGAVHGFTPVMDLR
jgi:quercetin dioxygenase-like cupin family protein